MLSTDIYAACPGINKDIPLSSGVSDPILCLIVKVTIFQHEVSQALHNCNPIAVLACCTVQHMVGVLDLTKKVTYVTTWSTQLLLELCILCCDINDSATLLMGFQAMLLGWLWCMYNRLI